MGASRRPTRAEAEKARRRGFREPPRVTLRRAVSTAAAGEASERGFFARLEAAGGLVRKRVSTPPPAAAPRCPSLLGRKIPPPLLRHRCAMSLLQAGVDTSVIALWLGHAGVRSTDAYVHADISIKERALALTTPASAKPGRYRPTDKMLAFLEGL